MGIAVQPLPIVSGGANPAARAGAARLADAALGPRDIGFVRTLRISVTDHCNFRCVYCMPEEGVEWLPKDEILRYEEIVEVARAAMGHGITDFKLTGGEPLLRRDLADLVARLRGLPGAGEISLTTNGLLLDRMAAPLKRAGLDRVTVSMDTLDAARFRAITRTGDLDRVWDGIAAAEDARLGPIKLNVVVMRGYNLDEVADFAALTFTRGWSVRFIEFMPLARSKLLEETDHFVPYSEFRARIETAHGALVAADRDVGSGPAQVFRIQGARGRIGFIHAMSHPFCSTCNRMRLTPEGLLRACLFDGGEVDVRPLLRPSIDADRLRSAFVECVSMRPDEHSSAGNRQMSRIGG